MEMKKLNIAIVCDPITHEIGGSIVSTIRFAELLRKRGHNIILFAAKYPDDLPGDYYHEFKIYRFFSVSLPYFQKRFRFFFTRVKKLEKIFREEKIDIVHTTMLTPSVTASIKAARNIGIKVISHPHAQPENIIFNFPKILQNKKIVDIIYNSMIKKSKKADLVICPTKFAESELKKRDPLLNTIIVSNGVDLLKFKKNNFNPLIKKYDLNKNEKRILCVARLQPEKSVETLIRSVPFVIENCKNVHFDIIGLGSLKESLEELSKKLGVDKNVTFFGRIGEEELLMAYNACHIFVLPSMAELEGMVVLESMACGKPIVIANSMESASRFFVNKNGFLFEPRNHTDLAEKLIRLLKDEKLRKSMGTESLKLSKQYDIHKSVLTLEKIYYSLVK
jgi:glycosyltransferase involved in cell wall biosynthesis